MDTKEVAFMCELWNYILQRFNKCSILLQSSSIELATAVSLMKSLDQSVTECREKFDSYAEVKVSRNGPERRSGKIIIAGTAFRVEFQVR